MQKREFNAVLKSITVKRRGQEARLEVAKAAALSAEVKAKMVEHLVRNRGPVLKQFVGPNTDLSWLQASGYMYSYHSAGFDFVGMCEHKVGAEMRQRANTARMVSGTWAPSVMAD